MKSKTRRWLHRYRFVFYALPILALWFWISIYTNLRVIPLSLYKWSPISSNKEFVGLYYFRMLFTYKWDTTWRSAVNTLLYVGYLFVVQSVLSMCLALALQKNTAHNKFFRALFFLPMVFSSVMVSMTWKYMYDPNLGVINTLLGNLGVEGFPGFNFFKADTAALFFIVLVHMWQGIGYPITLTISSLQTISDDLHEAARIDGANGWQDFWRITFPLLLPTVMRITLMTLSTGAMAYDFVLMLGSRATEISYDTWATSIYKETALGTDYGMVSAKSTLLFFILLVVCVIQYIITKKTEDAVLG